MKKALITGATKGIGKSTAITFAKSGWDLILLARDIKKLEVLKKEYQRTGIPGIAEYLCKIEQNWFTSSSEIKMDVKDEDPFNQLDLLMEKFKDVQKE